MLAQRYELRERLGAGRFGVVWRAFDTRLARDVALKVVPLPDDPRELERAEREAMVAARLDHAAVVTVYDTFAEDRSLYLVTELVRGPSLAQRLREGPLEPAYALRVGEAIAAALGHAHGRGVVHRDVKPANILLLPDAYPPAPAAKLADFGIAHVAGAQQLTPTGQVVGTPRYMAPERLAGEATAAGDVFALGATLGEALGGRPLTPELEQLVQRAVARDPAWRPSAEEARRAFAQGAARLEEDPTALTEVVREPTQATRALPREQPAPGPRHEPEPTPAEPQFVPLPKPKPQRTAVARGEGALAAAQRFAHAAQPYVARVLGDPRVPIGAAAFLATAALLAGPLRLELLAGQLAGAGAAALAVARPKLAWLALSVLALALCAAEGWWGLALVLALFAGGLPLVLARRPAWWWYVAAAPGLGAIGLAAAFPVLAARAFSRAGAVALALAGFVTLTLAEVSSNDTLLAGPARAATTPRVWRDDPLEAIEGGLWPLLTDPFLLFALAWVAVALVVGLLLPPHRVGHVGLRLLAALFVAIGLPATANEMLARSVEVSTPKGLLFGAALGVGLLALERWALPGMFARARGVPPPPPAAEYAPRL